MPLVPGPPVIVTNTPLRTLAAFLIAKVTSQVGPPAVKWSRGTARVTQVNEVPGQVSTETSLGVWARAGVRAAGPEVEPVGGVGLGLGPADGAGEAELPG